MEEEQDDADTAAKMQAARQEMGGEMTREQRLNWLRDHGVQVESPEATPASAPSGSQGDGRRFTYVLLPVDQSMAPEERVAEVCHGDALPRLLSGGFAGAVDDATLLQNAEAHGQQVSIRALRASVARGGTDTFRLAAPSEENGREAVNAYLDDCSSLKRLPLNERASALAWSCGFPETCQLHGDIFVGRVKWGDGGLRNVDFFMQELEPSSLWQRRAPVENLRFQQETRPEEHAEAELARELAERRAEHAGGLTQGYDWQDTEEDVEITLLVLKARKADVDVAFKRQLVEVRAPVRHCLELYAEVDTEACSWVCCEEGVRITLPKRVEAPWPRLLRASS